MGKAGYLLKWDSISDVSKSVLIRTDVRGPQRGGQALHDFTGQSPVILLMNTVEQSLMHHKVVE